MNDDDVDDNDNDDDISPASIIAVSKPALISALIVNHNFEPNDYSEFIQLILIIVIYN